MNPMRFDFNVLNELLGGDEERSEEKFMSSNVGVWDDDDDDVMAMDWDRSRLVVDSWNLLMRSCQLLWYWSSLVSVRFCGLFIFFLANPSRQQMLTAFLMLSTSRSNMVASSLTVVLSSILTRMS